MTARPLRAAVIGLGHMGSHHARVLRQLDGVRLVAAVDPAGDRFDAVPDIPVLPDLDELLPLGVDYAVLASPTTLHEPLGLALAAAQIPTLIEKPLAADAPGARRLAAAFAAATVPAAVGYVERCNPALIALHARLSDGILGRILHVDTRRSGPYPARGSDTGVVADLVTHDFDTTTWLTGLRYRTLAALVAGRRAREDLAAVIGMLDDATITHHTASWLSGVPERITIVTGERGCLLANTLAPELQHRTAGSPRRPNGEIVRYPLRHRQPLRTQHERFRDTVAGWRPVDVPLSDGVAAMLAAHAALEAARTGTAVDILHADCPPLNAIA
jgi:UDP-N-acetylglucosamine 3-dehydrogenase